METALEIGLDWIEAIQMIRTPALDALFSAITFLGSEDFYLLLAPAIIWCFDYGLGVRLGVLSLLSGSLNVVLKDVLMQPRPCDIQPEVCIEQAHGYGLPSGHAQNAIVFWGFLAHWLHSRRAWAGAIALMILIGFSRVYLGVHFPTDVLGGWTIGVLILVLYLDRGTRIEYWLLSLGTVPQILLCLGVAGIFIALDPNNDLVSAISAFAGLGAGVALTRRYVHFSATGPIWQRAVRYFLGVAIVIALFFGLRAIFPEAGEAYYLPFRILRYALIGGWTSFGGPWVFSSLRLTTAPVSKTGTA
ncbi:MAG: phosphatase PAP2 family protein [Chloroflexota bacterium]